MSSSANLRTQSSLRTQNLVAVLRLLMRSKPLSRTEIAGALRISQSTAGRVIGDLQKMNLIREVGNGVSSGGRIPQLLTLEPTSGYAVGVDISPTSLGIDVLDLAGGVVTSHRQAFYRWGDGVIPEVAFTLRDLLQSKQIDISKVITLGVAVPGVVDSSQGTVRLAPNLGWSDERRISDELRQHLGRNIDVFFENDVNACAYAEFHLRKSHESLVFVRLDSGLGAGIILNRKIWRGSRNLSGEIGFAIIGPQWIGSDYGKTGCLESFCSGPNILRRAEELFLKHSDASLLAPQTETLPNRLQRLFELAEDGNSVASQVVDETARYMAVILANISCTVDPDIIVMAGWVLNEGEILFDKIRNYLEKILLQPPLIELTILNSTDIVARGVTMMALERGQRLLLKEVGTREM